MWAGSVWDKDATSSSCLAAAGLCMYSRRKGTKPYDKRWMVSQWSTHENHDRVLISDGRATVHLFVPQVGLSFTEITNDFEIWDIMFSRVSKSECSIIIIQTYLFFLWPLVVASLLCWRNFWRKTVLFWKRNFKKQCEFFMSWYQIMYPFALLNSDHGIAFGEQLDG